MLDRRWAHREWVADMVAVDLLVVAVAAADLVALVLSLASAV
jgi:hypothetical protein